MLIWKGILWFIDLNGVVWIFWHWREKFCMSDGNLCIKDFRNVSSWPQFELIIFLIIMIIRISQYYCVVSFLRDGKLVFQNFCSKGKWWCGEKIIEVKIWTGTCNKGHWNLEVELWVECWRKTESVGLE